MESKNLPSADIVPGTRAVLLGGEASLGEDCQYCGDRVKQLSPAEQKKFGRASVAVICNVYEIIEEQPKWDRIDVYHDDCYKAAGYPHGELVDGRKYVNGKPVSH